MVRPKQSKYRVQGDEHSTPSSLQPHPRTFHNTVVISWLYNVYWIYLLIVFMF